MARVLCHRRVDVDDLGAPTDIVEVDTETRRVTEIAKPPKGYSLQRPIELADGILACYRLPAGRSTDLHNSEVDLVVDGEVVPRPERVDGPWWAPVSVRWDAQGHVEELGDGRLVQAVLERTRLLGILPLPGACWRVVATDRRLGAAQVVTGDHTAEPSVHPIRGLAYAVTDSTTVVVAGRRITTPGLQAYDPYVSPDGNRVVSLVRTHQPWEIPERWGLWVAELDAPSNGRWLVEPPKPGTPEWGSVTSHARWLDDTTVIAGHKRPDEPKFFSLWEFRLDGSRRRITLGGASYEQPYPRRPMVN